MLMEVPWYVVLLASMGWGLISILMLGLPGIIWLLIGLPLARLMGYYRGPVHSREVLPMAVHISLFWAAGLFPVWLVGQWLNQPVLWMLGLWLLWGLICGLAVAFHWQRRFAMPVPPVTRQVLPS